MRHEIINPSGWAAPKGYNNAIKSKGGDLLFVAGQVAFNEKAQVVGKGDFVKQFDQALKNFIEVVKAARGGPGDVVKMTFYVSDKKAYQQNIEEVGKAYRWHMGKHFPAMTLVEVKSLLEEDALIEIEGIAVI